MLPHLVTSTVSFTCGRSTCARPAWSCSSVSSHAWHAPLVEFPAACHVQVMSADIQVSARLAPDYLSRFCTLLTSVPGRPLLRSADANKLMVPRSCTASFGLRSFGSSGPTAWNDMLAHLRNLDLSLSDFRQLLKTALLQTVPV